MRAGQAILAESKICGEDLERRFNMQGFNICLEINTGQVVEGRFSEAESPAMGLVVLVLAGMLPAPV